MKPRILFLCTVCPFGDISGSGLRTRNIARLFERIGPTTMVGATERPWTAEQIEQTRSEFNLAGYFEYLRSPISGARERMKQLFDPRFLKTNAVKVKPEERQTLEDLIESHDVVWIHTLKLANAFQIYRWKHSIIDIDDYPSRFHKSAMAFAKSPKEKLRRLKNSIIWRRREADWSNRFTLLSVCKEEDRKNFVHPERVRVVPNGFTVAEGATFDQVQPAPRIGMIGDFNYLPNSDGLRWFSEFVFPQLRKKHPNLDLRLIGKGGDKIAATLNSRGITGLGYVQDPANEIRTWSAMIIPTRLGGGTHLKLAEGLARKVPIVSTAHGTRGYDVRNGEHLLVADSAADFARSCDTLITNRELAGKLVENSSRLFDERYSWDSIAPRVETAVRDCIALANPGQTLEQPLAR